MPNSTVPAAIPNRPFAICLPTNLMNIDGFFVINMGTQIIQAYVVNQSGAQLNNVRVYIEGISDPGVVLTPQVQTVGNVPGGASFPVRFRASFLTASPGIALVSFIVESDGLVFKRIIKKIFITRVDYHKPSKTYSVVMPQGTMRVTFHKVTMGPRDNRCKDDDPFVVLPQDVTYDWIPNPPYIGIRGPFPYQDPWWKIALAILAALFALGALLYDYFSDGTLDGGMVSVRGTFEETDPSVSCCTSVSTSATTTDDWLERGLYAAAGGLATAAIASDGPDLHYRGQEATPPASGELTRSEAVRLLIHYPVAPSPGRNYPIEGKWRYTRTTTGNTYTYEAADERENLHWVQSYEVQAPAVHDRLKGPLRVCARFQKPDDSYYKGRELYVIGVLVSTYGAVRRFELKDHGIELDEKANDTWYCGGYLFRRRDDQHLEPVDQDLPGTWYLFVFAQDVNTVTEGTLPFDAAHTIGGFLLTPQLVLNFNQPCELNHDAVIQVV
jgi:hypothetical protein